MILTIDIGNTNIELGVVDEQGIVFQERISTDIDRTELEYAVLIKNALEVHGLTGDEITGSIMSSVVPPLVHIIKSAIKKLIGITPMVVGAGLKTGLDIKIDRQTGVVVEASKDVNSLERLKDKQWEEYRFAVNKSEEQFIEEYVSVSSFRQAQ